MRPRTEEQARADVGADVGADTGTSTALVLVDRATAVERAYDDTYGHLKGVRPAKLSGNGYADGDLAGRKASLHSGRAVSGRRRPALEG